MKKIQATPIDAIKEITEVPQRTNVVNRVVNNVNQNVDVLKKQTIDEVKDKANFTYEKFQKN